MNPPFSITIEKITEATQCHQVVSQLLRIFPSLRLTITENETIPASSRAPQTFDIDAARAARDAAFRVFSDRDNEFRDIQAGRVGAYSDSEGAWNETRRAAYEADRALTAARCATPAGDPAPSYAWKPGEHTEAAADARIEADADAARAEVHGRNNYSDTDFDDSAYQ